MFLVSKFMHASNVIRAIIGGFVIHSRANAKLLTKAKPKA